MNWHQYFLELCQQIKTRSKDQSTKIGVVIVGQDNQIVSTGYNSFPRGIDDNVSERQERPEKYYWFSHAETNAIINCALNGVSTKGSKMYMTCGVPCADCTRNIINAGIKEIWCQPTLKDMNNRNLWEEHSKRSLEMFGESGVSVNFYE